MRRRVLIPAILTVGMLLAGCHEYTVKVTVDADGSGSRTTTLNSRIPLSPEVRHLMGLAGDGWRVTPYNGPDGNEAYRYRRIVEAADVDHWHDAGGTFLRGAADGEIRLVSEVQVRGTGDGHQVYRETLHWIGLQEKATAVVAQDYADMLHGEFPSLSDDLVREARAAVAAAIELNWAELAAAENVRTKEVEFAEQVIAMNDERFRQAGVAPDLAEKVAHRTAMWGYYDGLEATLPGLKRSVNAKLKLFVTMPAPISGGNADVVDGNTATFLLDLGRTVAEPVTLEVVCEP